MIGLLLGALGLAVAATTLPPRTTQFVYDTAGLIDAAAERQLELRHQELFDKAGVAIVVLTVPALVDETIDELAVRAGQTWGVGRVGEDRGLVVALAREDRQIFVATGYGTEGYLPDGRVGALIDEYAVPALQQGQFSDGLVRLSTALLAASAIEYGVEITGVPASAARVPGRDGGGGLPGLVMIIVGIIVFGLLARRHPMLALLMLSGMGRRGGGLGGGFGGGFGGGGFGGGGFGGGGAGRGF